MVLLNSMTFQEEWSPCLSSQKMHHKLLSTTVKVYTSIPVIDIPYNCNSSKNLKSQMSLILRKVISLQHIQLNGNLSKTESNMLKKTKFPGKVHTTSTVIFLLKTISPPHYQCCS